MSQKFVSLEIAKALKEAGYPQVGRYQYTYTGKLVDLVREGGVCYGPMAPSYIDAWLWLWREKGITLEPSKEGILVLECEDENGQLYYSHNIYSQDENKDPEEAIANAIIYLVENNLIK